LQLKASFPGRPSAIRRSLCNSYKGAAASVSKTYGPSGTYRPHRSEARKFVNRKSLPMMDAVMLAIAFDLFAGAIPAA
jgi:hypothetical protein